MFTVEDKCAESERYVATHSHIKMNNNKKKYKKRRKIAKRAKQKIKQQIKTKYKTTEKKLKWIINNQT